MKNSLLALALLACTFMAHAWNAVGHKLIAQIAFNNLTPEAKHFCTTIFNIEPSALENYFINGSVWLDVIRKNHQHKYDDWHYVDIPFTLDKSKLPSIYNGKIVWAIKSAQLVLSSKEETSERKAFFLKVLIHLVGDIHQPLHTTTKISRNKPKGDFGGTLYWLHKTREGKNLHQYWDNGGGLLLTKKPVYIPLLARYLEYKWPCSVSNYALTPEDWLLESHQYAINQVYILKNHKKPTRKYQQETKIRSEQQIAYAGCRLAYLLNHIAL